MTENLHQLEVADDSYRFASDLELVKLVSEDHLEFDDLFDPEVLSEVLTEIATLPDDETLVWSPSFSAEATDELDHDMIQQIVREGKPLLIQVLQYIMGRVFIELKPAIEFAGNCYVSMEVLN